MKEKLKFNIKVEWMLLKMRVKKWWYKNVKYR